MLTLAPEYGHEIAAWRAKFTDAVEDYASQSYAYSLGHFETAAEDNDWAHIGLIMDNLHPAASSTDQRYYGYDTARWAQGTSNAEAIEEALNAADDGMGWAYGPGETYVYDADNAAVVAVVEELEGALASYGWLNEERASELEDEENHPDDFTCHAGRDCGCYVSSHECSDVFRDGVESGDITSKMTEWHCPYCQEDREIGREERAAMALILARKWHEDIQAAGQMTVFMFVA
ncbi:hypothetical protein ABZT34_10410 [Streptomyces sp. NPDC005329]|uniref:hypothetical protein n=1 Tax=Streptomyces sp. NPDC005329 TaxID=3157034 RepID=UPI0033B9DDD3